MSIGGNSWLYPASHPTTGGAVQLQAANFWIGFGSGISADGLGYSGGGSNCQRPSAGYGPGAGGSTGGQPYNGGGAGYGGAGGVGWSGSNGLPYGTVSYPYMPGSGGGGGWGARAANGGGAVRIQAGGVVRVDGTITANGNNNLQYGGGGSGGGVLIVCDRLDGAGGQVRANGGNAANQGGGGGGGRIAVLYNIASQTNVPGVRFSTAAGVGGVNAGQLGTIYFPNTKFITDSVASV